MNSNITPERWAFDLTKVLNQVLGPNTSRSMSSTSRWSTQPAGFPAIRSRLRKAPICPASKGHFTGHRPADAAGHRL